MKLKDMASSLRPRERLIKCGKSALSDSEILALILQSGTREQNVMDLSREIITTHSLESLAQMQIEELINLKGIGIAKACLIIAANEFHNRSQKNSNINKKIKISKAEDIFINFSWIGRSTKEQFFVIFLNARNIIIGHELVSLGTLDSVLVHPREVFQGAIRSSANSIIIMHNHPSGEVAPSDEDFTVTKKIYEAGRIIGIELLDHLIISQHEFFSFKDEGYI